VGGLRTGNRGVTMDALVIGAIGTAAVGVIGVLGAQIMAYMKARREGNSQERKDALAEAFALLDKRAQEITDLNARQDKQAEVMDSLRQKHQQCMVESAEQKVELVQHRELLSQYREQVEALETALDDAGIPRKRRRGSTGTDQHRPLGPDRRTHDDPDYHGPRRRKTDKPVDPPAGGK
jgi:DNA gyrase/topoisomerase IV subunit A